MLSGAIGVTRRWKDYASLRFIAIAVALMTLARLPWQGHPVCLLRETTGIPCPFCGGTTAGAAIGSGHPLAAIKASPLAISGAIVVILTPVARRSAIPRWWLRVPSRTRQVVSIAGIVTVLAASEVWQLFRFGVI